MLAGRGHVLLFELRRLLLLPSDVGGEPFFGPFGGAPGRDGLGERAAKTFREPSRLVEGGSRRPHGLFRPVQGGTRHAILVVGQPGAAGTCGQVLGKSPLAPAGPFVAEPLEGFRRSAEPVAGGLLVGAGAGERLRGGIFLGPAPGGKFRRRFPPAAQGGTIVRRAHGRG
jgi:hypothetical protein